MYYFLEAGFSVITRWKKFRQLLFSAQCDFFSPIFHSYACCSVKNGPINCLLAYVLPTEDVDVFCHQRWIYDMESCIAQLEKGHKTYISSLSYSPEHCVHRINYSRCNTRWSPLGKGKKNYRYDSNKYLLSFYCFCCHWILAVYFLSVWNDTVYFLYIFNRNSCTHTRSCNRPIMWQRHNA